MNRRVILDFTGFLMTVHFQEGDSKACFFAFESPSFYGFYRIYNGTAVVPTVTPYVPP